MSYFSEITQNVIADAINSSTMNLSASGVPGDTFNTASIALTGSSVLNVGAIQVSLNASQNCIVYVDQSSDNINWDITDTFNYYTTKGGNGWTTQAISSYARVRVKNTGAAATTYFRVSTTLCPIVEAVPRSLSDEGNFKVGIYEFEDGDGHSVDISPANTLRTNTVFRLVGTGFTTTADAPFWTLTSSGSNTTASIANYLASLSSGTATNGYANLQSVAVARLLAGVPNLFRTMARITTPTASGCIRRVGPFSEASYTFTIASSSVSVGDIYTSGSLTFTTLNTIVSGNTLYCNVSGSAAISSAGSLTRASGSGTTPISYTAFNTQPNPIDGFYFELSPSGVISTNWVKGGLISSSSQGTWNGTSNTFNIDTNFHTLEIIYFFAEAEFRIDGVTLHTVKPTSTLLTNALSVPINATSINSGSGPTSGTIELGFAIIARLGERHTSPTYKHQSGVVTGTILKSGPGAYQ